MIDEPLDRTTKIARDQRTGGSRAAPTAPERYLGFYLDTLVRAAQQGDLDAFGELALRFQRMACAVAYTILGDRHLAEDAAQEAFIEAYQRLPALREPAAFPTWLRLIVRKRADWLIRAKQAVCVPLSAAAASVAPEAEPLHIVEARELHTILHTAIAALAATDRQLVQLFHLEGVSQREVAALTNLPEQVVKKRLFRARQRLRHSLTAVMPERLAEPVSAPTAFAHAVQFFLAVRTGNYAQVQQLLTTNPGLVNERERWDDTHARRGHMPAVGSFTALHRAAYYGDSILTALLLHHNAAVHVTTPIGQTPLHVAVLADQFVIVDQLLNAGANPNAATDRGQTPLHWAVIRRRHALVQRLLAAGADPGIPDCGGRTPNDWARIKLDGFMFTTRKERTQ